MAAFSLLSLNVLLPNSEDGWWVAKYYPPGTPDALRTWDHRQAQLRAIFAEADPDILCIQEAAAESFESDFGFLTNAGYDHVMHRKFRFRSATFWKTSRFALVGDAKHKNRTLISALRDAQSERILYLVNAHLTAGPAPRKVC